MEIRKNSEAIEVLSDTLKGWENKAGMVSAKAVHVQEVVANVLAKVGNLETRLVKAETMLDDSDGFQPVKGGCKAKVSNVDRIVSYSEQVSGSR